ncbi:hypothetical protein [Glutamicibacter uratoxydans]|uniref:hypothetical protein n=1 Tax=Glutamicibacter uratoxydans TaxID=43667 RepID=UPI003D6EE8DA
MSPRNMMLLQVSIMIFGIISMLTGRTGFGVFCLLAAMTPSIYVRIVGRFPQQAKPQHSSSDPG